FVSLSSEGADPTLPLPSIDRIFDPSCPMRSPRGVPGMGAALSVERLSFASLPFRALSQQVLILANESDRLVLLPSGSALSADQQKFLHQSNLTQLKGIPIQELMEYQRNNLPFSDHHFHGPFGSGLGS